MGLFSSKKKTYVSSVAYPLGEDDGPNKRDFLKYTVINSVLTDRSVGEALTQGYLRGQGMSLRNAFRYARDEYTYGVAASAARYLEAPDQNEMRTVLGAMHPGYTIDILTLVVGPADHEWFAEQYLTEEFGYDRTTGLFERPPSGVDPAATVAYDLEPSGIVRILLMNPDGSTKVVDFRPSGYTAMKELVHCAYQGVQEFDSGTTTEVRAKLPGEIDTVQTHVTEVVRAGETQTTTKHIITDVDESGPNATVTTSVTTVVRTRPQYFLYRLGQGTYPVLDAWIHLDANASPYYPAVPLRIDNVDICAPNKQNTPLYKTSKKLLDKVGLDIDDLRDSLNDNNSINDIDFAYVVFGVQLKVQSQEGKRYLYEYFKYLRGITSASTTKASHDSWAASFMAGLQSSPPPMNSVQIYSARDRKNNHDILLQWDYIDTSLKSGQVFEGAKIGDVAIVMGGSRTQYDFKNLEMSLDSSKLYARKQLDEDTYEELEIAGLYYENFIYDGKSVSISAYDAFHDNDEEGFILPLNQQVLRSMSLRDTTDLAYHCMHMVLNCYQVVKQKWYQRGIFKLILVIVSIVIIVMTWGTSTPAVAAAMAAAMGGSMLAIIVAATAYVMAAMVLTNIIMKVSVELFGEKWGAVIATIAMFVAGNFNVGSAGRAGAQAASTGLTAAQVINGTGAVLNAYTAYAGARIQEIQADITRLNEEYELKFDELEEMTEKMLGTNTHIIDIQAFTEATYHMHYESLDNFLTRTLLTGSDIAEITNGQVSEFAALGLQLPTIG